MELFLSNLIRNNILQPVDCPSGGKSIEAIHRISVYENNPVLLESLQENTLVFVPRGMGSTMPPGHLQALAAARCAVVLYEGETPAGPSEANGRPALFSIPRSTTISQAVEACYSLAYSGIKRLVEVSLDTMEQLSQNLLSPNHEDNNMIKVINDLLGCPVAFTTSDFHLQKVKTIEYLVVNPLYAEDSFDWDMALESFRLQDSTYDGNLARGISGAGIGGYLYQNPYCESLHCRICIFPIADVDAANCYGYIFLALGEDVDALSPEMNMKLQQVLVALKFEIIKSDEIAHTINRYYDFLLDELIESDQTDFRKLMQKYGLVQKVVADEYYVFVVGRKARTMKDVLFHELLTSQQFNLLYDGIVDALGTINFFIFERKDSIVVLLPEPLFPEISQGISLLASVFRDFLKDQYEGAGVSDLVPTERVRQGYFQARKALAISYRSKDKAPCFYAELGILRFFFDRSNQVDLTPLLLVYRKFILPVIEYDKSRGGQLFPTLTTYISCCSSPSAACAALYIHKNTLYSRLNKISQLLEVNLSDSENIFNISLGIRVHTLIEAGILPDDLDGQPQEILKG